jgi:hypothetical protein
MTFSSQVLEHDASRHGRWLRQHRARFTLWIAVVEGILVVAHVIPTWPALAVAVIAVGFWWYAGRHSRRETVRQGSWILAASQLLVLLVPLVLFIATTIAVAMLVLFAIAALVFLFTERP